MMIYSWLTGLKNKIVPILGAILGVLMLYISALKRAALRKELNQQKAGSDYKDRANKALSKGLENEAKKPTNRGYFDDNK